MKTYTGRNTEQISFPMGGIGAGMLCLQGNGSFGSVSFRHRPSLDFNPLMFSAVTVKGHANGSRILEAPVPDALLCANRPEAGNGLYGKNYGLPRFSCGEFTFRFPFATVSLADPEIPLAVEIKGWSPFVPNDEDRSSLPFAGVEYTFANTGASPLDIIYYFNSAHFLRSNDNSTIRAVPNGFVLEQSAGPDAPWLEAAFGASVGEKAYVDTAWFRDNSHASSTLSMLWKHIVSGICTDARYPDPENGGGKGATIAVPFHLEANQMKTIILRLCWYVPFSDLRIGTDDSECEKGRDDRCGSADSGGGKECRSGGNECRTYRPWYTTVIGGIDEADRMWKEGYRDFYRETKKFSNCFYDSSLPDEILEAVSANLCILKSPTVLRQTDGRIWGWEGCNDNIGSCYGSCTHVWNYAQSICHLFPRLERSLRESEFYDALDEESGHQQFRVALPIRKSKHDLPAASDGQLGGIIKAYRDWRISGDNAWLLKIWPRMQKSLEYCINQWDTEKEGIIKQPHHNTFDIEFWGPDSMTTSLYLAALRAACEICRALDLEDGLYRELYQKGRSYLEDTLFNGEYFHQNIIKDGLSVMPATTPQNAEIRTLVEQEGPLYQYGNGCLSDGAMGVWLAEMSGLSDILDEDKLQRHLQSVYRYNFRTDLFCHANPQRPGYASKHDAGLLVCTWPKGGRPTLPLIYCDEVWTGTEYQAASHLISKGYLQEGLDIVRACRTRYDGTVRNPFDEYECGHWYARAMASYALLQAFTGVRYDNIGKVLYYNTVNSRFYKTFLAAATGYGTVEVQDGNASVTVVSGMIEIKEIVRI